MRPEECPHKASTLDGKKCYCEIWGKWTNCLEAGHCVYESMGRHEHLGLFDEEKGPQ